MAISWAKIKIILGAMVIIVAGIFIAQKIPSLKNIPNSLDLKIPFSPQAPTNNWSRNEDCEETSITMTNAFLTGNTAEKLPAEEALKAINNLKSWEQEHLGYNANTGVDATIKMAEGAFGLKIRQINNYSEEDLKQALAGGHPLLLPINAKLLHNPKYADNGPLYHMIVIRGYKGNDFIANDPGTDSGESNIYSFATLKAASADWDQTTNSINAAVKVALVVSK